MQLSVIILNYNVRYFLELCLRSVERALEGITAEIIVVDNNSPDDSCQMVQELFPNVVLIENKENVGFAKANNRGVQIAKGEYVCILNPDTVVTEYTFHNLLKFANSKDDLGVIGCQLIDGTGNFLPESKRNLPTPKVSFQKIIGNDNRYYANHLSKEETGVVSILVGAFMLMKRNVYLKVGGFDERYFMYGEDIDLSYTIEKAGYINYYVGSESIIHFKGESTLKDKTYAKRFYGAMKLFYKKHFKNNFLMTLFVNLGARLIPLVSSFSQSVEKENYTKVVAVSNCGKLLEQLKNNYDQVQSTDNVETLLKTVEEKQVVVFDADELSYFQIISKLKQLNAKGFQFRILPNSSNFIVGSDNSVSRGEVLVLNKKN